MASPPWPAVVGQRSRLSTNPTIAPQLPAAADTGPPLTGSSMSARADVLEVQVTGTFSPELPSPENLLH